MKRRDFLRSFSALAVRVGPLGKLAGLITDAEVAPATSVATNIVEEIAYNSDPAHLFLLTWAKDLAKNLGVIKDASSTKDAYALANAFSECAQYLGLVQLSRDKPKLSELVNDENYLKHVAKYADHPGTFIELHEALSGDPLKVRQHIHSILNHPELGGLEDQDWTEKLVKRLQDSYKANADIFTGFDWRKFAEQLPAEQKWETPLNFSTLFSDQAGPEMVAVWKQLGRQLGFEDDLLCLQEEADQALEIVLEHDEPSPSTFAVQPIISAPDLEDGFHCYRVCIPDNAPHESLKALSGLRELFLSSFGEGFIKSAEVIADQDGKAQNLILIANTDHDKATEILNSMCVQTRAQSLAKERSSQQVIPTGPS